MSYASQGAARSAGSWIANSTGSSYVQCPAYGPVLATEQEFRTAPPGQPSGKYWNGLMKNRPNEAEETATNSPQGRYYGYQSAISDRVFHNACAAANPGEGGTVYPFWYRDDWPSPDMAFQAADGWWHGRASSSSGRDGPPERVEVVSDEPIPAPTIDVVPQPMERSRSQKPPGRARYRSDMVPVHVSLVGKEEQCSPASLPARGRDEGDAKCRVAYVRYPLSSSAFRLEQIIPRSLVSAQTTQAQAQASYGADCLRYPLPDAVVELGRQLDRQIDEWIADGHDLRDRIFYCGSKYAPYVQHLHACPALRAQKRAEFQKRQVDLGNVMYATADLPLSLMGNPAQCFQYARTYAIPTQRNRLYFHEKELED